MTVVTEPPTRGEWAYTVSVEEELKISPFRRESAAEVRRAELLARRAAEMAEKKAARLAWAAMPKRLRGLSIGCAVRKQGFYLAATVYEFPERRGNALFRLYDVWSATTYVII